jgi:hypothetical protein
MRDPDGDGDGTIPNVHPIRPNVFESTVFEMAARAYGFDPLDHTRNDLVGVMTYVQEALDAKSRVMRTGWNGTGFDSYVNRRARLVEYLRDDGLMSDLYEDDDVCKRRVQMSWDNVLAALAKKTTASRPSRIWLMDELAWFRLDGAVDSGEHPSRTLARELDIGLSTLQNLYELYQSAGRGRVRI